MNLFHRFAVYPGLGLGHSLEDGQAGRLDRIIQGAGLDKIPDIGKISMKAMHMGMSGVFVVLVLMLLKHMGVPIAMGVIMRVLMGVPLALKADINARTMDTIAGLPGNLQCKLIVNAEFGEFAAQILRINSKIDHGGQVHVAADPGKTVIVEDIHEH